MRHTRNFQGSEVIPDRGVGQLSIGLQICSPCNDGIGDLMLQALEDKQESLEPIMSEIDALDSQMGALEAMLERRRKLCR